MVPRWFFAVCAGSRASWAPVGADGCRGAVSVLAGSGSGNAWEWQDLEGLASIQTGRIRALMGEGGKADDSGSA